jgi:hypothetical protein
MSTPIPLPVRTASLCNCVSGRLYASRCTLPAGHTGYHKGEGAEWPQDGRVPTLKPGDVVHYHSPSWGEVYGRVIRRAPATSTSTLRNCVLVQDLSPNGAREWWKAEKCAYVGTRPTPTPHAQRRS